MDKHQEAQHEFSKPHLHKGLQASCLYNIKNVKKIGHVSENPMEEKRMSKRLHRKRKAFSKLHQEISQVLKLKKRVIDTKFKISDLYKNPGITTQSWPSTTLLHGELGWILKVKINTKFSSDYHDPQCSFHKSVRLKDTKRLQALWKLHEKAKNLS